MSNVSAEHFSGCLLGLCLADAIGAIYEGIRREDVRQEFSSPAELLSASRPLTYTDDGEMCLALARYLGKVSTIAPAQLMAEFVKAYSSWRGYGHGTQTLIDAYRYQIDWNHLAQTMFPGGSYGNGAAMRSAPVGLRYFADHATIWQQAERSAYPTHRNELAIEGAQLIALATSLAIELPTITPQVIADQLRPFCKTITFQKKLDGLASVHCDADIDSLGNGIEAHESVVTALAAFSLHSSDYQQAIATAIWQGGDTDTIAAMTGALSGARLTNSALPTEVLQRLEGAGFVDEVDAIAATLLNAHLSG